MKSLSRQQLPVGVMASGDTAALLQHRQRRRREERSPELRMFSILESRDFSQQPEAFSQNDKAVFVCMYQRAPHTHTQSREPFNQSPCLGLKPAHSYTSGVACAYFISPTEIDLSSEVRPCFIFLSSHRSARILLPRTSTGSHSIWRWKS